MKLLRGTINGFGRWQDYSIDFSKSPFLCMYGENESGKSTIQQFVLFMLFGLPPKKRAFFQPKSGGAIGGRLTVFDDSVGEFTIERFDSNRNGAASCYTPDGRDFDEDWLKGTLKGMTHRTYQSIFSFSALDLSILQDMNEEDLGEVLLGIGLTGSKNIYSIEKRIDTEIGELFKPYGKKPVINQQLDALDELFRTLTTYKHDEASYREKKDTVRSLTRDIQTIKSMLNQENQMLSSIERQQQSIPLIHGFHNYSKQLASFSTEIKFPEDGLNRLYALKERILPIESELSILEDNQKKYKEKQTFLKQELYKENVYDEANMILQTAQEYRDNEKEITKLKEAFNKLDIQLDNELNELNVGLKVDDLASISFPFHIENSWNQLKNDYSQFQLEKEQCKQEETLLMNQWDNLINQQQELKASLPNRQQIANWNETINEYNQQMSLKKLKEDSFIKHEKWQQLKKQKGKNGINLLIGSIILASISGSLAVLRDSAIFYSLMAILVLVGIVQWLVGKQSIKNMEQMLLHDNTDDASNPVTREAYEEAENSISIYNKKIKNLDAMEDQLKGYANKGIQLDEKNHILDQKEKRLKQKVNDQYIIYPFLRNVDLPYWTQFYHTIKHLLQKNESRIETQEQIKALEESKSLFHHEINRFFNELNWESSTKPIVEQIKALEDLIEHYGKSCSLLEQYDKWISEAAEQFQNLKQKLRVYEKEKHRLYDVAAVKTEEAFFQQAKKWNEKQRLEEKVKELNDQLLAIFREDEWDIIAKNNMDTNQLEIRHEEHIATIKKLETELEEKRQQLADVNADLTKMETSETYSESLHRFNMEQENLHHLAREWAVLKTAKEMLNNTKRKFRDKYLTRVIDKTSYYFEIVTNHNYKQVFAPTEDQPFQVLAADNLKYTVKELSQGTTDQLYVALRIAISEVMSEKYRLPFIIDDAFVHFDATRTAQVMKILSVVAENQQVILFTCKKDVVETENTAEIVFIENTVRIN